MIRLDYNFSSNASKSASSKSKRKAMFCRLSPRRSSRFRSTLFSRSSIFFNVPLSSALGVLSFFFLFFSANASLGEGLLSFFLSSFSFFLLFSPVCSSYLVIVEFCLSRGEFSTSGFFVLFGAEFLRVNESFATGTASRDGPGTRFAHS